MPQPYNNPEPVPPACQLVIMPFLAGVEGYLQSGGEVPKLRTTMHRVMNREGSGYLQQACAYLPIIESNWRSGVGRIYPVNEGIIGAAFKGKKIWRTKSYPDEANLLSDLGEALKGSGKKVEEVAKSYLAIPFLGPQGEVVLVFYADCDQVNFFADDCRIRDIVEMCRGFSRLFDKLQVEPFPTIRNFPLELGTPVIEMDTLYQAVQEALDIPPPLFIALTSFNYEASVA